MSIYEYNISNDAFKDQAHWESIVNDLNTKAEFQAQ